MCKLLKQGVEYLVQQIIIPNIIWSAILDAASAVISIKYIVEAAQASINNQEIPPTTILIAGTCCLICLLSLVSNILFFIAYKKTHQPNQPYFPKLETDYRICSSEFELFFQDRKHIIQRQKITYQVIAESLEEIPHSMQWTGDGYGGSNLDPLSINKGYVLEEKKISSSIFHLAIKFPEKKMRGYSDTYSFETKIEDSKGKMLPVLGRLIKCQTDQLCLKVTAPPGVIENCKCFVSADIPGELKLSPEKEVIPEQVGEYWCYKWTIPNLELLRYYILQWSFVDKN